jgi:hypothetical protein
MKAPLKISPPSGSRFLSINLKHILTYLTPECDNKCWRIVGKFEAVGDTASFGYNVLEIQSQAERGVSVGPFTWEELKKLAEQFFQVIDGTFIGYGVDINSPEDVSDHDLYSVMNFKSVINLSSVPDDWIIIQIVDSSYWLVFTQNDKIRLRIKSALGDQVYETLSEKS